MNSTFSDYILIDWFLYIVVTDLKPKIILHFIWNQPNHVDLFDNLIEIIQRHSQ